jgi:hypothetical protein
MISALELDHRLVQNFDADMASPRSEQLGTPNPPEIRFAGHVLEP